MHPATVRQLNRLNQQFYDTTAEDFDESRQYFWPGWQQLLPTLHDLANQHQPLRVLDLGCGNGRFGQFLAENLKSPLDYTGVDANLQLLKAAKQRLSSQAGSWQVHQLDLVEALLNNRLLAQLNQTYDLVVMFGLLHHLPSNHLRLQLLSQLSEIAPVLIATTWQFLDFPRLRKKIVEPHLVGLDPNQLELNDYLLDWQRGPSAYRYCHYFTPAEATALLTTTGYRLTATFTADGKEGSVNRYYLAQAQSATSQASKSHR